MITVTHVGTDLYRVMVQGQQPTTHEVTMSQADYRRLSGRRCTHEWVLVQAFRFLLEQEPNTAILARFAIMDIAQYYPDFEREMTVRLADT